MNVEIQEHYLFTIPQGSHWAVRATDRYDHDYLSFAFRFDESARYDLADNDQMDINKLFGFQYGSDPHENSARFGWRWDIAEEYIIIAAYVYVNGNRHIVDLGYCFIDQICSAEIEETEELIIFRFQGGEYSLNKSKTKSKSKYLLFPYFGGNKVAPHDIKIELWF